MVAILKVVEVTAEEVFRFVISKVSELIDTVTLALLQRDVHVDHGLEREEVGQKVWGRERERNRKEGREGGA